MKLEAVTLTVRIKPLIEMRMPAFVSASAVRSRLDLSALRKKVLTRDEIFLFFLFFIVSDGTSSLFKGKLQNTRMIFYFIVKSYLIVS